MAQPHQTRSPPSQRAEQREEWRFNQSRPIRTSYPRFPPQTTKRRMREKKIFCCGTWQRLWLRWAPRVLAPSRANVLVLELWTQPSTFVINTWQSWVEEIYKPCGYNRGSLVNYIASRAFLETENPHRVQWSPNKMTIWILYTMIPSIAVDELLSDQGNLRSSYASKHNNSTTGTAPEGSYCRNVGNLTLWSEGIYLLSI